jgi:hypothetical protein
MSDYVLSYGNRKLPRSIGIFNLPSHTTCPGITEFCSQHCYAKKAERMYPPTLPFRNRMLEMSEQKDFDATMIDILNHKRFKTIRIHESGDFYNQEYLDKWISVAHARKDILFYCYTRSYLLDFSERPENMIARVSIDHTSNKDILQAIDKFDGSSFMAQKNEKRSEFKCPGSCRSCSFCLTPGDVYFPLH